MKFQYYSKDITIKYFRQKSLFTITNGLLSVNGIEFQGLLNPLYFRFLIIGSVKRN